MRALLGTLDSTSRATSYLMGGLAVILAIAVLMTSSSPTDIASWAREVLGWTFVGLLGGLVFLALFVLLMIWLLPRIYRALRSAGRRLRAWVAGETTQGGERGSRGRPGPAPRRD